MSCWNCTRHPVRSSVKSLNQLCFCCCCVLAHVTVICTCPSMNLQIMRQCYPKLSLYHRGLTVCRPSFLVFLFKALDPFQAKPEQLFFWKRVFLLFNLHTAEWNTPQLFMYVYFYLSIYMYFFFYVWIYSLSQSSSCAFVPVKHLKLDLSVCLWN